MSSDSVNCIVCLDRQAEILFEKCSHPVMCKLCASQSISRNNFSCPKCRVISDNLLCFDEIDITASSDNKTTKYNYKNYVETIDFPIYFILKKHIEKISSYNYDNENIMDIIIEMAKEYYMELKEIFPKIKEFKRGYMFFARLKYLVRYLIFKDKCHKFPSESLKKFNNEVQKISGGFVQDVLLEAQLEHEKKKKEYEVKRNELSALIIQIEDYLNTLEDPLKSKLLEIYKNGGLDCVLDEELDEANEKYERNLAAARLIINIKYNDYNSEERDDTERVLNDLLGLIRESVKSKLNTKKMRYREMNNTIETFLKVIELFK
jgi:Zinc finger, C3HC4 type (RING finger)